MTEPHTASEPSGKELVIVGMAGRRNGPPLCSRYDDDDDDDEPFAEWKLRRPSKFRLSERLIFNFNSYAVSGCHA